LPFYQFQGLSILVIAIMCDFEQLSSELNKWTKPMLIEFILKKSSPPSMKLSDDLYSTLYGTNSRTEVSPTIDTASVALILKSVVDELKTISNSNLKLHDKLNKLSVSTSTSKLYPGPKVFLNANPLVDVQPVPTSDRPVMPANRTSPLTSSKIAVGTSKKAFANLPSVPVARSADVFVSRFCPQVTIDQLKNELFSDIDVTITQMVTKHPSYASFHIRLPAAVLPNVL
jgi:hypothetical protein